MRLTLFDCVIFKWNINKAITDTAKHIEHKKTMHYWENLTFFFGLFWPFFGYCGYCGFNGTSLHRIKSHGFIRAYYNGILTVLTTLFQITQQTFLIHMDVYNKTLNNSLLRFHEKFVCIITRSHPFNVCLIETYHLLFTLQIWILLRLKCLKTQKSWLQKHWLMSWSWFSVHTTVYDNQSSFLLNPGKTTIQ